MKDKPQFAFLTNSKDFDLWLVVTKSIFNITVEHNNVFQLTDIELELYQRIYSIYEFPKPNIFINNEFLNIVNIVIKRLNLVFNKPLEELNIALIVDIEELFHNVRRRELIKIVK